jgi:hypothetical protein
MATERTIVTVMLLGALIAHSEPHSSAAQVADRMWSNVMYLGGVAGVRGKSLDWNNRLTIASDKIVFSGKTIRFEIETSSVRRLDYKGHQHVNDGAVGAGFAAGGLLGALAGSAARSTDHYLEVGYVLADGSASALLLRLHKDNQEEIIAAMHAATGIEK